MLDGAEAPALRGVDFLNGLGGRTTDELFEYVRDGCRRASAARSATGST